MVLSRATTAGRCWGGTWARAFLIQWTRHLWCVAWKTLAAAARSPLWSSAMTSLPAQSPVRQRAQERRPEGLSLGGAGRDTQDLPPPVRVDADCDYHGHRDDPARFPDLQIGGIDP